MRMLIKDDIKKTYKNTVPRYLRLGDFTINDIDELKFQFYGLCCVSNVWRERILYV